MRYRTTYLAAAGALLVLATLAFVMSSNSQSPESERIAAFNKGVLAAEAGNFPIAAAVFFETIDMPPAGTVLEARTKFNLATLLLEHAEEDETMLLGARGLLIDALRITPDDIDIRKQLEIVNSYFDPDSLDQGEGEEEPSDESSGEEPEIPAEPGEEEEYERPLGSGRF